MYIDIVIVMILFCFSFFFHVIYFSLMCYIHKSELWEFLFRFTFERENNTFHLPWKIVMWSFVIMWHLLVLAFDFLNLHWKFTQGKLNKKISWDGLFACLLLEIFQIVPPSNIHRWIFIFLKNKYFCNGWKFYI